MQPLLGLIVPTRVIHVYILDMIELPLPLGLNKYDTWGILLVKCYIDNSMRLQSYIRNANTRVVVWPPQGVSAQFISLKIWSFAQVNFTPQGLRKLVKVAITDDSSMRFDSIWVIMDWFTKSAHFIPVHTKYRAEKYAMIYIAHVLCLHGVLKTIISDWWSQFVARLWEQLHTSLRTHLIHSLVFHPQTDGQTEQVKQILEDMFRACVMEHQGSGDKNLL
jgi:hypothetical protein